MSAAEQTAAVTPRPRRSAVSAETGVVGALTEAELKTYYLTPRFSWPRLALLWTTSIGLGLALGVYLDGYIKSKRDERIKAGEEILRRKHSGD